MSDENMDDEQQNKIVEFLAKLEKIINYLDKFEGHCIICEKITKRHVVIMSPDNGSDLGFGSPQKGNSRYGIACVCVEHDLDENINEKIKIALEIKKLTNRYKLVKDATSLIDDSIS